MDDMEKTAWLARRLTFGSGLSALPQLTEAGLEETINTLLSPDEPSSPWDNVDVPADISLDDAIVVVDAWLNHLSASPTPLADWTTWFWHDHFSISAPQIKNLDIFTKHIDLLSTLGRGSFRTLIRAVTVDPAMLVFLDGRRNRAGAVNENYGRELLELYTLGVGNYDEDDVRAAAVALTGWTWNDEVSDSVFVSRRHDSTPQSLLGATVDDLDSVIDVLVAQPDCARHIATHLADALLGHALPTADLDVVSERFRANELDVSVLLRDLIDLALDGAAVPIVLSPVQWFLQAQVITTAELEPGHRLFALRQMGQVPGVPPNVGGYPDALTWAGPSTTVGRFRAASLIAGHSPDDSTMLERARARDWDAVAELCGRPDGFSAATLRALDDANTSRRNGRESLAAVLMTPELAVA